MMGLGRMFLLSSQKAHSKKIEDKTTTSLREMDPELEKKFPQKALFGNCCRTYLYTNALNESEKTWLEASENEDGSWHISKIEEKPNISIENVSAGQPLRKISDYKKSSVSFPVMLKILGEFEASHTTFNLNAKTNQTELTPEHYKDLALREGIIFDAFGHPHPSQNDCIITEGHFSVDDHDSLRNRSNPEKLGLYLVSTPLNNTISSMIDSEQTETNVAKDLIYVESFLHLIHTAAEGLKTRQQKTSYSACKFQHMTDFPKKYMGSSDKDLYMVCVGKPVNAAQTIINKLAKEPRAASLVLFFDEFKLFIGTQIIKDCLDEMKSDTENATPKIFETLERFIEKTSQEYIEHGATKSHLSQLESYLYKGDTAVLADEVINIINHYQKSAQLLLKKLESDNSLEQLPLLKHRVSGPKPGY
jgi:hypothetical protein